MASHLLSNHGSDQVAQLGVFNPVLAPTYCDALLVRVRECIDQGKRHAYCYDFAGNRGNDERDRRFVLQPCQLFSTSPGPMFGNINVGFNTVTASQYYPNYALANGILLYTGNTMNLTVYCYGGSGQATGPLGSAFAGQSG